MEIEDLGRIAEVKLVPLSGKKEILSEGMLWHCRLGHASLSYLKQLQKLEKNLKGVIFEKSIEECEVCKLTKMKKLPFGISRQRAGRVLHTVHSDIMGPINPAPVPGQIKFIITFVDDCSRFAEASLLRAKLNLEWLSTNI